MSNLVCFSSGLLIGYITHVSLDRLRISFPSSTLLNSLLFNGETYHPSIVGTYLIVEGISSGFLIKITEYSLPENERKDLTQPKFNNMNFHPIAAAEIIQEFSIQDFKKKSIHKFPPIGSKVFVATNEVLEKLLSLANDDTVNLLDFGNIHSTSYSFKLDANKLLGRHCAIIGTTGSGKSWTMSRIIEQLKFNNVKVMLFDPTGEFKNLVNGLKGFSCNIGLDACFNYQDFEIEDLFILLKPSINAQRPLLIEAIKSLKLASALGRNGGSVDDYLKLSYWEHNQESNTDHLGCIYKTGKPRRNYFNALNKFDEFVSSTKCDFEIKKLPKQLDFEAIFQEDRHNTANFGLVNDNYKNYCATLKLRILNMLNSDSLNRVFNFKQDGSSKSLLTELSNFMTGKEKLMYVGLDNVGYDENVRELLMNAICRQLLILSRTGMFRTSPLVLAIDESHQFLNKQVNLQDSGDSFVLNSIDIIAKESRKNGLFLCLCTQMPRDIPIGTLSQIGTFLVHKLVNEYDKDVVGNAVASNNKSIVSMLPSLEAGECIIVGDASPLPVLVSVSRPLIPPTSDTPQI